MPKNDDDKKKNGTTAERAGYPWHTGIVATTFWVGEIFDPERRGRQPDVLDL